MISRRVAQDGDVEAIVRLINSAFVVERFFIERDRANPEMVRASLEKGKFLLLEEGSHLAGCVYVELRGERGYFGLLAVDPARQRAGLGRHLVESAEEYFRAAGCRFSDLRVVSVRAELPPFYRSLGYVETGTSVFTADVPPKISAHFILMTKPLV